MVYKLYLNKAVFFKAYIEDYENITFRGEKREKTNWLYKHRLQNNNK